MRFGLDDLRYLIGVSRYRYDKVDAIIVITIINGEVNQLIPTVHRAKARNPQCHRYREYDKRPIFTKIFDLKSPKTNEILSELRMITAVARTAAIVARTAKSFVRKNAPINMAIGQIKEICRIK